MCNKEHLIEYFNSCLIELLPNGVSGFSPMSSAYGSLNADLENVIDIQPIHVQLKDGSTATLTPLLEEHRSETLSIFTGIIRDGDTYPQENELSMQQFVNYFNRAFVLVQNNVILGAFYCKPNFPGRCSHICNGGFIVHPKYRGLGVGIALGEQFLKIAPKMGFKAAMFNLVFESNLASVKLWNRLGFQVIGRVPKAGRLRGNSELIDALMYYKEFE